MNRRRTVLLALHTIAGNTLNSDGSNGGACMACHMPKIEAEIPGVFVSAHTFAFIPPAMTDKYKIPNPCTTCHMDKTTEWAGSAISQWSSDLPWCMDSNSRTFLRSHSGWMKYDRRQGVPPHLKLVVVR